MSFDFSALITDRSQADLDALRGLLSTPMSDWTAERLAAFNLAKSRGAYNYTDLNRVTAAMEALDGMLRAQGYESGYQKLVVNSSQSGGGLPEGYTELEYIQSSGNAYIDTDFKPNQKSRVRMDVEVGTPVAATMCFFGARNASQPTATQAYNVWVMNTGATIRSDFFGANASLTFSAASGTRILIDKDKNICHVNDETITNTQNTGQATLDLFLLACNDIGSPDYSLPAKLYSCQIYDNGLLVRDFVPCIDPEGTVGLYDLAGGTFYGNSGTGAFTAGYTPKLLPDGSTELEWIQSDGNQYIDTDFVPNNQSGYYLDFQLLKIETADLTIMGVVDPNICLLGGTSRFNWAFKSGTGISGTFGPSDTNRHLWEMNFMNSGVCKLDESEQSVSQFSATNTRDAYIFATHYSGSGPYGAIPARVFAAKISSGDNLVKDYVPCKTESGEIGLYDRVSGTVYTNAGTEAFTAGPVVPDIPEPDPEPVLDPYTWYEKNTPTETLMAAYLANVNAIWGTLLDNQDLPETMAGLTTDGANRIEQALLTVLDFLERMAIDLFYCGEVYCGEV